MAGAPNFANRTMWTRDNLDVLRGLNSESIDLVYADPPFNSNKNYEAPIGSKAAGAAFKDTWTLSDVDLAWHGEIAEREPKVYAAIDNAGIVHGKGMKSYLIMMAVRLLELRRVLKPTGSLYLHCDDTADGYLRLLGDAVFGHTGFRNTITWKRTSAAKGGSRTGRMTRFGRATDTLLLYAHRNAVFRPVYVLPDQQTLERRFSRTDPTTKRRFRTDHIEANAGLHGGNPVYTYKGYTPPHGWMVRREILEQMDLEGRLYWSAKGRPYRKYFLDEYQGIRADNLWADIAIPPPKERTGYPTQKPLALLDRIIEASSNPGDVVLDPFCGCATACVSAESLRRQWIGIDLSPVAATLVESRLHDQFGIFAEIHHRTDIPQRTDLGDLPNYRTHKHALFGKQEGHCAGCRMMFPFRNFEIDHVIPRAKGGSDHVDNLQLLCGACNRAKGTGTQAKLIAKLKERGQLAA